MTIPSRLDGFYRRPQSIDDDTARPRRRSSNLGTNTWQRKRAIIARILRRIIIDSIERARPCAAIISKDCGYRYVHFDSHTGKTRQSNEYNSHRCTTARTKLSKDRNIFPTAKRRRRRRQRQQTHHLRTYNDCQSMRLTDDRRIKSATRYKQHSPISAHREHVSRRSTNNIPFCSMTARPPPEKKENKAVRGYWCARVA